MICIAGPGIGYQPGQSLLVIMAPNQCSWSSYAVQSLIVSSIAALLCISAGSLMMIRPCKAVADHMMQLVTANPKYQFTNTLAERSFLQW